MIIYRPPAQGSLHLVEISFGTDLEAAERFTRNLQMLPNHADLDYRGNRPEPHDYRAKVWSPEILPDELIVSLIE